MTVQLKTGKCLKIKEWLSGLQMPGDSRNQGVLPEGVPLEPQSEGICRVHRAGIALSGGPDQIAPSAGLGQVHQRFESRRLSVSRIHARCTIRPCVQECGNLRSAGDTSMFQAEPAGERVGPRPATESHRRGAVHWQGGSYSRDLQTRRPARAKERLSSCPLLSGKKRVFTFDGDVRT